MKDKIKREMMTYYNERAEEYDEIYLGKGHTLIETDFYLRDVREVSKMISMFGRGHLIDIACGTGFWVPNYAENCEEITFVDQSTKMLKKCKERVNKLCLSIPLNFIKEDFFDVVLENSKYDCALIGFFLSHLTPRQTDNIFLKLNEILKANSQLLIIDSAWNKKRKQYMEKEGTHERVLIDGRRFTIYKKYFELSDIEEILGSFNFRIKSHYTGTAYISVIAEEDGL